MLMLKKENKMEERNLFVSSLRINSWRLLTPIFFSVRFKIIGLDRRVISIYELKVEYDDFDNLIDKELRQLERDLRNQVKSWEEDHADAPSDKATKGGIDLNPTIARTSINKADGGIDFGKVDEAMVARLDGAKGFTVHVLGVAHVKNVLPLIGLAK